MELEHLQKIWNEQKGETMYAINKQALHEGISRKKKGASKRMSIVEICLMLINGSTGTVLIVDAILDQEGPWEYASGIMLLLTVVFLAYFRAQRLRKAQQFDRTMLGELDHAIANSDSMLQVTHLMIKYYLLPFGVFTIVKTVVLGGPIEQWLLLLGAFALAFFLVWYERKVCHIPRKERLIGLKKKLENG